MLTKILNIAAEIAVDLILEPLPEDTNEDEYDIYGPSSRSIYVNEDGTTEILLNSPMGTKINDDHNKY